MPHLCIDATHYNSHRATGVEYYVQYLLPLLSALLIKKGWAVSWIGHTEKPSELGAEINWIQSKHTKLWSQRELPKLLKALAPDYFFTPSGIPPLTWKGKSVIAVHDLAVYEAPDAYSFADVLRTRLILKKVAEKASLLLVPSLATKQAVERFWKVKPGVVAVTPLAFSAPEVTEEVLDVPTDKPIISFIGRVETKKNIRVIVDAFIALPAEARLVIAGKPGKGAEELAAYIEALPEHIRSRIHMTGYLTEGQREWLLNHSTCMVVPGVLEGFSLPLLEAMSHGLPTICADAGPLPEIGGEVPLYVQNPLDWTKQLHKLLSNPSLRQTMARAGKSRANEYTWAKCAEKTAEAILAL